MFLNENFVTDISQQVDFFVNANITPEVLYETLKAYIRGEIISYTGYERIKNKMTTFSQHISQLDNIYANFKFPDILEERLTLQAEFVLMTQHTTKLLLRSRARLYENGDKSNKLLAHQLHRTSASRQIPEIKTTAGVTTNAAEINAFREYYESLYLSDQTIPPDFNLLFDSLHIPSIDQSVREDLILQWVLYKVEDVQEQMDSLWNFTK